MSLFKHGPYPAEVLRANLSPVLGYFKGPVYYALKVLIILSNNPFKLILPEISLNLLLKLTLRLMFN